MIKTESGSGGSYECSGQYMFILDKYYRKFLRDALKPMGMTCAEGMAVLSLYSCEFLGSAEEGCTQEELNEALHYDKAALTRAMKQLEKKGMVIRKPNLKDKRSFCFILTKTGKDAVPFLIGILVKWEKEIFKGVSKNEKEEFIKTIIKVADNAEKAASLSSEDCFGETD